MLLLWGWVWNEISLLASKPRDHSELNIRKKSEESVIRWKFALDWSDTCNWKFIAAMFLNFGLAWSAWPNQEKLKILAAMNSQLRISLQSKEYFLQTQTLYLLRIFHFFWRNWRHVQIPSSVWKAEKKIFKGRHSAGKKKVKGVKRFISRFTLLQKWRNTLLI